MLDYSIKLQSFIFLQRAKSPNLPSKNKEAIGVALTDCTLIDAHLLNTAGVQQENRSAPVEARPSPATPQLLILATPQLLLSSNTTRRTEQSGQWSRGRKEGEEGEGWWGSQETKSTFSRRISRFSIGKSSVVV
jgi:hypothetical protein